jgi:Uma2 family endonuclease
MARQTFASWAELAPDRPAVMTADELARLPDDGWTYELVEGRLVRMPLAGTKHGRIAAKLLLALGAYTEPRELGILFTAETGFLLSQPEQRDTVLGADVSFLRAERVPPESEQEPAFWRVAPDLAAEVASPDQHRPELAEKARRCLEAGVRLVWVLWPKTKQVDVWRAGASEPVLLTADDALDGLDVLPGFTYPVAQLFA